ncbi:protein ORANGE, chloroplastic isoform X2 [Canna indica]|uniref:Protein ORANGE, chloroplastic isoform X2 n=1 Tax=Canna indica TaxID=4628 RepID=A0AAQ3KX31_9LILI|nr:protein ORANGE, chloroplastic isoform X2 [Canna indica]
MHYASRLSFVRGIITFCGLLESTLDLKVGLGGTSYSDFTQIVHAASYLPYITDLLNSSRCLLFENKVGFFLIFLFQSHTTPRLRSLLEPVVTTNDGDQLFLPPTTMCSKSSSLGETLQPVREHHQGIMQLKRHGEATQLVSNNRHSLKI